MIQNDESCLFLAEMSICIAFLHQCSRGLIFLVSQTSWNERRSINYLINTWTGGAAPRHIQWRRHISTIEFVKARLAMCTTNRWQFYLSFPYTFIDCVHNFRFLFNILQINFFRFLHLLIITINFLLLRVHCYCRLPTVIIRWVTGINEQRLIIIIG